MPDEPTTSPRVTGGWEIARHNYGVDPPGRDVGPGGTTEGPL
ncbi:MAG TPA: hypothetical protein VF178_17205 [Gemmatimonadaceae bacterium]